MEESVDISPMKDGGVLKVIVKEGFGDELPPKGCKVVVHYTGSFINGNQFDSSRDRNDPFIFDLAKGNVIKAWDIGVATMRRGERAILICSPEYAYGEAGSPPIIPANATLKFDIEVVSWQGEDLSIACDGGIQRLQITEGEGYSTPNDAALVYVHIIGKYENQIFDERDLSFNVGEGSEVNVIPGIETAITKFKRGEKSRLIIKPIYAFGKNGSNEYNIPPNATVEYIVTLKKFERAKEICYLDSQEKIEQSKLFKDKGTAYYKEGKYDLAIKMYERIQQYLESDRETCSFSWTHKAKLLFLDEYKKRHAKFRDPKHKKKILWSEIAKEMELHGYDVNGDILDRKLRNMKHTYKNIIDNNNKKKSTGKGRIDWEYFNIFNDIFCEDKSIHVSSISMSSLTSAAAAGNSSLLKSIENLNEMQKQKVTHVNEEENTSSNTPSTSGTGKSLKKEREKSLNILRKRQLAIEEAKLEELKKIRICLEESNAIQQRKLEVLKQLGKGPNIDD